jgi:glycosyltransferase involved in cell wall biosynthesis
MNIAVNARLLIKDKLEGIGRFSYETTKRLAQQHPEHTFYLIFDRKYDEQFIFSENVKPLIVGPKARHPFLYYIWMEWSVAKLLKQYDIDVFYSPETMLCLNTNIPSFCTYHDLIYARRPDFLPFKERKYLQLFSPKFAKRADHIFTVSNFVYQDLRKEFPNIDKTKVSIAYNALPLDRTQVKSDVMKRQLPKEYFLCISSIHPRKNIDGTLVAFKLYLSKYNKNTKLVLIGRPYWKLEKNLQDLMAVMIAKEELLHLKDVKDDEIGQILKEAKALLYLSHFEGFGIPILEAMANGVPVIASNTSSMPEVAGDAAILCNPLDLDSISEAMHKVTTDGELQKGMIKKGYERVKYYNWDATAAHIYDVMSKFDPKK